MSMNLPGSGGAAKKDSIFSSISPAPYQPPAGALPSPQALRPAADPEVLSALKSKMDAFERNISSLIEKKLGEQAKAEHEAPAQPRPPENDQLYRKIDDLERRLSDFGQAASFSASQLKNIEESKISARREIEDLLKAVREQQKYSEIDRQMHDQLEKSWKRVEDIEKKLMDFYTVLMASEVKRREETAASSDKSAAAIEGLNARFTRLEEKLSSLAAYPLAVEEQARFLRGQASVFAEKMEEFKNVVQANKAVDGEMAVSAGLRAKALEELTRRLEEDLRRKSAEAAAAAQEAASREFLTSISESAAPLKEALNSHLNREVELLREKISGETGAFVEQLRKGMRAHTSLIAENTAEFEKLVRVARHTVEGAETLEASTKRQAAGLEELAGSLETGLRGKAAAYAAEAKKAEEERFKKFGDRCADALLSAAYMEGFRSDLGGALEKLEAAQTQMRELLKDVPQGKLENLVGVSGMLVRKRFETIASVIDALGADCQALSRIKGGVEERFKGIFGSL